MFIKNKREKMNTKLQEKIEVIVKKPTIIEYNKHSVVLINPDRTNWIKTSASGRWIFNLLESEQFTLDELKEKKVYISDPFFGKISMKKKQFNRLWTKYGLVISKNPNTQYGKKLC